ncbi:MAG TPA: hypothetical protein VN081_04185, partial [Dongiaceae bacterium]|nr:hypothetical protein [Dongiaceae bacterium]
IQAEFNGEFPQAETDIVKLPGVGKNTAGAIAAYSFNQPSIFVETNIRTVYIHHFFSDDFAVDDKQIIEMLQMTIDRKNPRRFYQNLMDYGTWLKANGVRNNASSKHYKKQSPLRGSVREVRGRILRELAENGEMNNTDLRRRVIADERYETALTGLLGDKLIMETNGKIHLTN